MEKEAIGIIKTFIQVQRKINSVLAMIMRDETRLESQVFFG